MDSDIFSASCFEQKQYNMSWNFSEGNGDIQSNIVIVGLYISLKLIEYQSPIEYFFDLQIIDL